MTVRPATASDAAAIAAIINPIITGTTITFAADPRAPSQIRDSIAASRGAYFVVEQGGAVAGFCNYTPFRGGAGYARTLEHTVVLASGARGAGLGRALMTALEAHAIAAGGRSLVAAISAENEGGLHFHAALDFTEVGRVAQAGHKFDRWIDLVLMQKMLHGSA
ncbi:GNAT family N-acetyltransferase [Roseivivax sediminis]|uniref:Phosphinothricin acetyltransferase n=1 Tax=Roseivivax sediminis TaxID=936889 RepID=A0A1I1XK68_9RHOB|nr:GNAT family N-acetyltransferase [Roseivivax sediminis]SFE07799.1 phosphinothricin acetyltransferase [Roseivivax sediminis]